MHVATPGQVRQRTKFSITIEFLKPLTPFLRIGFQTYANKKTAFNAAMSYNVNNAVKGEHPDLELDFSKILVSRGSLLPAENAAAIASGGNLNFTWPDKIYYGRGDVQLTWYENYLNMGRILNLPLLEQPELALQPDISARLMIEGMTKGASNRGDFTGVSLENYFNSYKDDPIRARRIVNGLDQANRIADYHYKFLNAIKKAS